MLLVAGETRGWGIRFDVFTGDGVLSPCDGGCPPPVSRGPNMATPTHDAAELSAIKSVSASWLCSRGRVRMRLEGEELARRACAKRRNASATVRSVKGRG